MVDVIFNGGNAYEYTVAGGWHFLWGQTERISAGIDGYSDVVFNDGNLYTYTDWNHAWHFLGDDVYSATAGTDLYGRHAVTVMFYSGWSTWEYSFGAHCWTYLDANGQGASHSEYGLIDFFSGGHVWQYDMYDGAWTDLGKAG